MTDVLAICARGFLTGVLALGAASGCSEPGDPGAVSDAGSAAEAPEPGPPAPDFVLKDLSGREVTLAEFRGRTVVIDFWATWCPPCIFQVPELNALHAAHAEAGDLAILGVAVDVEGVDVVAPWAAENDMQYTVLLGDENLARKFGAMGFPTLVVVTPDGSIDSLHVGLIEIADLERIVADATPPSAT